MIEFPRYVFIDDATLSRATLNNIVRSEMEVGPDKTRPIQSVPMFNISFSVAVPVSRFNEFNTWLRNDNLNGTAWFLLKDPFDGVKKRFRFVNPEFRWVKTGVNLLMTEFTLEGYDELQPGI